MTMHREDRMADIYSRALMMIARKILPILFILCAASACAADWGAFVAHSSRSDDALIVTIMRDADLETRLQICRALGARKDPYAEDILGWLLSGSSQASQQGDELLLRVAMKSIFDESLGEAALKERLDVNASFVEELGEDITRFHDLQLKGDILRLLPHISSGNRLAWLMEAGAGLVALLTRDGGLLSPAETGLAHDYLAAVETIGTADFSEQCLEMARLSRDRDFLRAAREAAAKVATLP